MVLQVLPLVTDANHCRCMFTWSVALGLEFCGPARHIQLHHEFSGDEVTTNFFLKLTKL